VASTEIVKAVQAAERNLIADIAVFDRYEGAGIPEGKISLALAVTLQPVEKTLTDIEIEAIAGRIIAEVAKKTGAQLRG
jgi:phenylalanyl-tRNA synthetase beta chain